MAWADAKARIVEVLETLAITEPEAQTIKRVYPNLPGTIGDVPCVVVYPPADETEWPSSSLCRDTYTVRLRLLLTDADLATACALVDAYREALKAIIRTDLTLNLTSNVLKMNVEEASSFSYGNRQFTGMDAFLTVILIS
jgi:hypothetical protein